MAERKLPLWCRLFGHRWRILPWEEVGLFGPVLRCRRCGCDVLEQDAVKAIRG